MSAHSQNAIAKCLAAIFGIALFFAMAAFLSGVGRDCRATDPTVCPTGYVLYDADLYFGVTFSALAVVALTIAIAIRRHLGGPLIGPWKHW